MKEVKKDITEKQMASMHIAYRQWAELLNDAGYSINSAVKQGLLVIDIPFTEGNVKEIFAYPTIKTLYPEKFEDDSKKKHPRLKTTETNLLFDVMNANFALKFGVSIDFPHEDKDDE